MAAQTKVDMLDVAAVDDVTLPTLTWAPIDGSAFPRSSMAPRLAANQIQGLRNLDATPRLNLASFVTTQMDPE